MLPLDHVLQRQLHVVAQEVEAELVVGAVGDVAGVVVASLLVAEAMDDRPHRQAQELVDPAHPLGVARGQVVVDRDDVDAVAGEGVQVRREGGDQGLALAGLHLADVALVEHQAADELDVEGTHLDRAPGGLADHREGVGEDVVQARAVVQLLPEGRGHRLELRVRGVLVAGLQRVDPGDRRAELLDRPGVLGPEDLLEYIADAHVGSCSGLPLDESGARAGGRAERVDYHT